MLNVINKGIDDPILKQAWVTLDLDDVYKKFKKIYFVLEEKVDIPSKYCKFKQHNLLYTIYPHVQD